MVKTRVEIDDTLAAKAMKLGGHKTRTEAVTRALTEYVQRLEQMKIISMFGTIDFDSDYDYKKQRSRT